MSNEFWTSDTHFSHARIIELCKRPFADIDEMDETMIDRWNDTVGRNDMVWHLGDVALGKIALSLPLVGRLNGYKVLVPGNHDRIFSGEKQKQRDRFLPEYQKVFNTIGREIHQVHRGGINFMVSHFPYQGDSHGEDRHADKRPTDEGLPLIHGHVHEKWKANGRQFNVGVDVNSFRPVPTEDIVHWAKHLI